MNEIVNQYLADILFVDIPALDPGHPYHPF